MASLDANNGVQRALRYVGTDGLRQDVAHKYLHPKMKSGLYENLHVVVNSRVKRVIFDNKRACGVEYAPNSSLHPTATIRTVRARKLVIISSGALGTPSVLERSGLGKGEILNKTGINVIADLPGIGENYQDHHCLLYSYLSSLREEETLDVLLRGRLDVGELIQKKADILGWNAMDIIYKIRPTETEVAALGPEFHALWEREYQNEPSKPLASGSLING